MTDSTEPRVARSWESTHAWALCPWCGERGRVMLHGDGHLEAAHYENGKLVRECRRYPLSLYLVGGERPDEARVWREALEDALGVSSDPENHTPKWAHEIVRILREIGNRQTDRPRGMEVRPHE